MHLRNGRRNSKLRFASESSRQKNWHQNQWTNQRWGTWCFLSRQKAKPSSIIFYWQKTSVRRHKLPYQTFFFLFSNLDCTSRLILTTASSLRSKVGYVQKVESQSDACTCTVKGHHTFKCSSDFRFRFPVHFICFDHATVRFYYSSFYESLLQHKAYQVQSIANQSIWAAERASKLWSFNVGRIIFPSVVPGKLSQCQCPKRNCL